MFACVFPAVGVLLCVFKLQIKAPGFYSCTMQRDKYYYYLSASEPSLSEMAIFSSPSDDKRVSSILTGG